MAPSTRRPGRSSSRTPSSREPRVPGSAPSRATPSRVTPSRVTPSRAAASSRAASESAAWLRGLRFSGFSLLMMGLLILGVVVLAPNISAFVDQRQQIAELSAQLSEDGETVDRLTAERERWNDSTFVMTQARERFFYVNPGEVSFLVINDLDAAVLADVDDPVSSELTTTDTDWTRSLLASLLTSAYAEEVAGPSE